MFSSLLLAALAVPALAQSQNITFLTGLLTQLQAANLTSLATVAASINQTSTGQRILSLLSSNTPFTVFAPNNQACAYFPLSQL